MTCKCMAFTLYDAVGFIFWCEHPRKLDPLLVGLSAVFSMQSKFFKLVGYPLEL